MNFRRAADAALTEKSRFLLVLISTLILAALSPFASAQGTDSVASRLAAQNALFNDAWQADLKMNPLRATAVGDYRYNDQLGDYSLAASAARHQRDVSELARIKAIDADRGSPPRWSQRSPRPGPIHRRKGPPPG